MFLYFSAGSRHRDFLTAGSKAAMALASDCGLPEIGQFYDQTNRRYRCCWNRCHAVV
jgi:hypothetical protein